jgi:hypothetical protein
MKLLQERIIGKRVAKGYSALESEDLFIDLVIACKSTSSLFSALTANDFITLDEADEMEMWWNA